MLTRGSAHLRSAAPHVLCSRGLSRLSRCVHPRSSQPGRVRFTTTASATSRRLSENCLCWGSIEWPPRWRRANLLCQGRAVLFRPVAILRYRLQWWSAFGSAGARSFHLGFGHAGAGSRFHAGTDINDVALRLQLAARGWWILSLVLGAAA
jgi:hypothetical protein